MSDQPEPIYIPPFAHVRLVECRDFMHLAPVPAYREFFAYGKKKARDVTFETAAGQTELIWPDCAEDEEVWAVCQWVRYEDGHHEEGTVKYLREPASEADAKKAMEELSGFYSLSRDDLISLAKCLEPSEENDCYIESRYPNYQFPPKGPNSIEAHDVYQARLKALAGLHPKTVALIRKADAVEDLREREKLGREAVQAYFAELAHDWTEDEVLAWQRTNPLGTAWMCEFAHVLNAQQRTIDPINYELAFNWLRRKYNLLTAKELAISVSIATGSSASAGALKKTRERLGLTTKRSPGPKPNSDQ